MGLVPGRFAGLDDLLLMRLGIVRDFLFFPGRLTAAGALEHDRRLGDFRDATFLALAAAFQMRLLAVHPAAGDPLFDADFDLLRRGLAVLALLTVELLLFVRLLAFRTPDGVLDRGQITGDRRFLVAVLGERRDGLAHRNRT